MKKTFHFLILIIVVLSLSGCMSPGEKWQLSRVTAQAEKYIEAKYDRSFTVKNSGYYMLDSTLFATYSDNIYVQMRAGTRTYYVHYDVDKKEFSDDYQADLIGEALTEALWEPLLDELAPYGFGDKTYYANVKPYFNFINTPGLQGSFFHEYFDGNVDEFIKKETLTVQINSNDSGDNATLYLISEDETSWRDRYEMLLDHWNDLQISCYLHIIALSPDLYEREVAHTQYPHLNINMEGCYAYGYGDINSLHVQHYIKVADGIYMTANEGNFMFEDGDILLREVMTSAELQDSMDAAAQTETSSEDSVGQENSGYYINAVSPVYEVVFSDRLLVQINTSEQVFEHHSNDFMDVYVRIDTDELGISEGNSLYAYSAGSPVSKRIVSADEENGTRIQLEFFTK